MDETIDLMVSTYERTYRTVLAVGFFPGIEDQNRKKFTRRIAVINNVRSMQDARDRADRLVARGEIDEYIIVSDFLDRALRVTGLSHGDLGRFPHWTDWALVAVSAARSDWILNWDAEISIERATNWIDPAIALMKGNETVLVANPNPDPAWLDNAIRRRLFSLSGDFGLGYGFSDQVFLARSERLARPIYKEKCLASLRYPLAHLTSVFEERVDSYMRNHRLLRAMYIPAVYKHPEETAGLTYPRESSLYDHFKKIRNEYLYRKLRNRQIWKILELAGKSHLRC